MLISRLGGLFRSLQTDDKKKEKETDLRTQEKMDCFFQLHLPRLVALPLQLDPKTKVYTYPSHDKWLTLEWSDELWPQRMVKHLNKMENRILAAHHYEELVEQFLEMFPEAENWEEEEEEEQFLKKAFSLFKFKPQAILAKFSLSEN